MKSRKKFGNTTETLSEHMLRFRSAIELEVPKLFLPRWQELGLSRGFSKDALPRFGKEGKGSSAFVGRRDPLPNLISTA